MKKDLQELKDLEQPEGDAEEIDPIWTSVDDDVARVEEASADPDTSLEILTGGEESFREAEKLAGDYGMKACAE